MMVDSTHRTTLSTSFIWYLSYHRQDSFLSCSAVDDSVVDDVHDAAESVDDADNDRADDTLLFSPSLTPPHSHLTLSAEKSINNYVRACAEVHNSQQQLHGTQPAMNNVRYDRRGSNIMLLINDEYKTRLYCL